jgi:hypothetical protein
MSMSNAAPKTFQVPYLLSFGTETRADGSRVEVMGRGNAGWTTADFADGATALAFAEAVPRQSRTRAHARVLAQLAPHAAALEAKRRLGRA